MERKFNRSGATLAAIVIFMLSVAFLSTGLCVPKAQATERQVKYVLDGKIVTVVPGDTLSYLCLQYLGYADQTVCKLAADLNGRSTKEVLKPGEKWFFPFVYRLVVRDKDGAFVSQTNWCIDKGDIEDEKDIRSKIMSTMQYSIERM